MLSLLKPAAVLVEAEIETESGVLVAWNMLADLIKKPSFFSLAATKNVYHAKCRCIEFASGIQASNAVLKQLNGFLKNDEGIRVEVDDFESSEYYKSIIKLDEIKSSWSSALKSYVVILRENKVPVEKDAFYLKVNSLIQAIDEYAMHFRLGLAMRSLDKRYNAITWQGLLSEIENRIVGGDFSKLHMKTAIQLFSAYASRSTSEELSEFARDLKKTKKELQSKAAQVDRLENQLMLQEKVLKTHGLTEREYAEHYEKHIEVTKSLRQEIARLKYRISELKMKYEAFVNGDEEASHPHPPVPQRVYEPGVGKDKPPYQVRIGQTFGLGMKFH